VILHRPRCSYIGVTGMRSDHVRLPRTAISLPFGVKRTPIVEQLELVCSRNSFRIGAFRSMPTVWRSHKAEIVLEPLGRRTPPMPSLYNACSAMPTRDFWFISSVRILQFDARFRDRITVVWDRA